MNRAPNFDRLAGVYRWMEMATFGRSLWRCRCRFLDELRNCRTALVLGDGDGRFTARLLDENPHVCVDAIDTSGAMLRTLLRNAGVHGIAYPCTIPTRASGNRLIRTTTWSSLISFLIASRQRKSPLWLNVYAPAPRIKPSGSSRSSPFPQAGSGRLVAQPLVKSLYLAFRMLTGLRVGRLPQHRDALSSAGFVLGQERPSLGGLLVSEVWVRGRRRSGRIAAEPGSFG
jgi:hypothetical protein